MTQHTLIGNQQVSSDSLEKSPETRAVQVIEPPRGFLGINWAELWRCREIAYFLAWREVKVRYKQTALGAAWAILQPLLSMLVFTLFLGKLAGLEQKTGKTPYFLYVYVGLLPWTFFANALTHCSNSLVANANMITKIYLPRLLIPISSVGSGLVDFAVSSCLLIVMLACYTSGISWQFLLTPLFLLGILLLGIGIGAALSALTVSYRDFQYVVPFSIQLWMFITPVIYPASIVPAQYRWLYGLNPMAGLIEGFRSAVLARDFDWVQIGISFAASVACFLVGIAYFRNVEHRFADSI